jgi:hypothetical protein
LHRNCLLKYVIEIKIEGMIEVTGRRGRRFGQLLGDLNEKRIRCKLKGEALDRTCVEKWLWICHKADYGTEDCLQRHGSCACTRQAAYL